MSTNIHLQNIREIALADSALNDYFIDVLGNKTDAAAATPATASIVAMLRYIIANYTDDAEVLALIGAINTAAHTGAVDNLTTVMGYIKQLVTDLRVTKGDLDDGGRLDLLIDQILADTDELQTDWVNGGRLDLLLDAIKAVTDVLPDAGALTSIAQATDVATIDGKADTISTAVVTTIPAMFNVPTQDLATDALVTQVVGKKSDTVAGTSIVSLVKQANAAIGVVDGLLDVPTQDLATNATINQVVGNKTDTVAGTSLVAIGKQILAAVDVVDNFIDTEVSSLVNDMAKLPKSDGTVSFNTTALGSFNAEVVNVIETDNKLNKLVVAAEGAGAFPASVVDNSILSLILSKVANGDTSSYSNLTDSLEAASDKLGAFSGDGGANQDDSVKASLDLVHTDLDSIIAKSIIASGTFTTDSATVPADTVLGGTKATNYYNGCILLPTAGACAYQPRRIKTFTTTTGVFTLEPETPFTGVPGLSTYIILSDVAITGFNTIVPASPTAGSLYDILSIAAGGNTFDKSTDSLEAISDKITTVTTTLTAGVPQTATVTTVDASTTPWTIAAHRLFTVTGVVKIHEIFAIVSETVVEGVGADNTLSIGTSDDVDLMIGVTVGDALVANDIWANVAGTSSVKNALLANNESFVISSTDIDINVLGSNSIVDGTITFYCTWTPISVGATLVAAVWD